MNSRVIRADISIFLVVAYCVLGRNLKQVTGKLSGDICEPSSKIKETRARRREEDACEE